MDTKCRFCGCDKIRSEDITWNDPNGTPNEDRVEVCVGCGADAEDAFLKVTTEEVSDTPLPPSRPLKGARADVAPVLRRR